MKEQLASRAKLTDPLDGLVEAVRLVDNRLTYESGGGDIGGDHGGKVLETSNSSSGVNIIPGPQLTVEQLASEVASVALDWTTLRNVRECSCSTPFDHFSRKYHCWRCGEVFCTRCIDKHSSLPGHHTQRAVPVCRTCYHDIRRQRLESIETP